MTRGVCVCGRAGFQKCTVHGDPVKGVGVTDEEFKDLIARNRGAVLEILQVGEVVPFTKKKIGRPRSKGGAR